MYDHYSDECTARKVGVERCNCIGCEKICSNAMEDQILDDMELEPEEINY